MGKSIQIIFNPEDIDLADRLLSILSDDGYTVKTISWGQASTHDFFTSVSSRECQLIISLNMVGFSYLSSDGGLSINQIPVNIIALMTSDIRPYASLLSKRINYTVSFLLKNENDVNFVKSSFPHLYQVSSLSSPDDITKYLSDLDWRF